MKNPYIQLKNSVLSMENDFDRFYSNEQVVSSGRNARQKMLILSKLCLQLRKALIKDMNDVEDLRKAKKEGL